MSLEKRAAEEIKIEVLVIGSEAAGAKAAIEAQEAGADVLMVTKGLMGKSGTTLMAGRGVQAPIGHMDPRDNPSVFFNDVINGGAYLNNQKLVERLTELAVTEVTKMEQWGAKFLKKGDKFVQYYTPGATYPRSLHPIGQGGVQWRRALVSECNRRKTKVMEDIFITSLLLSHGQVAGALGISLSDGKFVVFRAKKTVLATGGCPQIYRMTDASRDATGDGINIAYKAGAELMDMEFQQFFPYACYTPPFEMAQFTGGLRYFINAKFYNSAGEPFMERYLGKERGLRDETSRAIYLEAKHGFGSPHGGAYLAINHLPENLIDDWIAREKPPYLAKLQKAGIDIRRHALECGPACHYSMGGVRVNENCETTLPNLYAIGEVAAGMDGAERIDGGPAITWCLTMGYIVGKDSAKAVKDLDWLDVDRDQLNNEQEKINSLWNRRAGVRGLEITRKVKDIMYDNCSLVKEKNGLEQALNVVQKMIKEDLPRVCVSDSSRVFNKGFMEALEAINMTELSEMVIRSSLMREESRGSHYRTDFLKKNNEKWLKNIVIRQEQGKMAFSTIDPVITRMKLSGKEVIEE